MSQKLTPAELIKTLKAGDVVTYVTPQRWGNSREINKIEVIRFTPTQVVCKINGKHDCRFKLSNGAEIGGGCWSYFPLPATEAEIAAAKENIEVARLAMGLRDIRWREIPLDKLRRIAAIINEGE